jgi:hypothetical protein
MSSFNKDWIPDQVGNDGQKKKNFRRISGFKLETLNPKP